MGLHGGAAVDIEDNNTRYTNCIAATKTNFKIYRQSSQNQDQQRNSDIGKNMTMNTKMMTRKHAST